MEISRVVTSLMVLVIAVVFAQKDGETLMYEEDSEGQVLEDKFPQLPSLHKSTGPTFFKQNPSSRLSSCSHLGAGRFSIFGSCSEFLECVPDVEGGKPGRYRRRILQCRKGLWFSRKSKGCALPSGTECPQGRLVSNPPLDEAYASCADVDHEEVRTVAGCSGFFTCRPADRGVDRYTYECASGYLWSGTACVPKQQVNCTHEVTGKTCARTCLAGDVRTCSFDFVLEEFASMSIYCKKCPFIASDCDLPGCVPGGGVRKNIISINRQVPGPDIQVCKGDTLEIKVVNRLPSDAVTIHWHGLHQRATPYMDGVPHVTQCPIPPGNSFTYRMIADVSGTHMYHSHIGHQETDGFHGPMIVREPRTADPVTLRYDSDLPNHHMIIWHWFDRSAESQFVDSLYISKVRDGYGLLVNGKGGIHEFLDEKGLSVYTPSAIFNVMSGVRFRFRAIFNTAITCPIQLSIDGHVLDVLATDGRPIQQMDFVDSVIISAGERVDFVPHPGPGVTTSKSRFYIRMRGLYDCDEANKHGVVQTAMLSYDGSTVKPKGIKAYSQAMRPGLVFGAVRELPTAPDMPAMTPVPLTSAKDALVSSTRIDGTPDKIFYLDVRFNSYTEREDLMMVLPQINNITYMNPSSPPLTQPLSVSNNMFCKPEAPTNCVNGRCECTQVLEINKGDLVEFVMFDPAGNDVGHPFHMHGYAFKVLGMEILEGLIYPQRIRTLNEQGQLPKQFDGPLKDTVIVPGRGYTVLRFIADNPGYWMLHCHISTHMALGMALVIKVGERYDMVQAPANFPTCGNYQSSSDSPTKFSLTSMTLMTYLVLRW